MPDEDAVILYTDGACRGNPGDDRLFTITSLIDTLANQPTHR